MPQMDERPVLAVAILKNAAGVMRGESSSST